MGFLNNFVCVFSRRTGTRTRGFAAMVRET